MGCVGDVYYLRILDGLKPWERVELSINPFGCVIYTVYDDRLIGEGSV